MQRLHDRPWLRDPRRALALVVVVALTVRLAGLGVRVAHWDEGRVGYWILRTAASGHWEYRPIIHGPFVQHVTRWVIAVAGASDFVMRLPVAILGSLFPLSALLFRTRLQDTETIALGVVLALNPLLLYYSRFMRSDLPLAVFAFVTFGALVAAIDTDRRRYLHLAAIAFALALTTKENAILYPVSWLGAIVMVGVGAAVAARRHGRDPIDPVRSGLAAAMGRVRSWGRTLLLIPLEMLPVLVFFYAPRSPDPDAGLWSALADPSLLPRVVWDATVGSAGAFADLWLAPDMHAHPYAPYLAHFGAVLALAAAATVVFAVVAIRWHPRPLVAFCGWWALSAVVGYPYVADIKAPWLAVHVVVALAIPAAIGLVAVFDRLPTVGLDGHTVATVGLAALLVSSGAFVVGSSALITYQQPPHGLNVVAQGGQPGGDLRPIVEDLQTAAATNEGADVLYYGDIAVANESHNDQPPAASNWYDRLPLPWYTEATGATVTSAADIDSLPADPPPVVIADSTQRDVLHARLPGYSVREEAVLLRPGPVTIGAFGFEYELGGQTYVFFVDRAALATGG
ncbi:flippase activity-associated protein Agl23 [Halorhabdus sp. CBA1104]|uniref:flippase activity-associated protein Agl23 n=1 Tax=Halorhabdus sp. CBA1104 TaxID=1380432 RepID=UPI0018A6AAF9|nr:flippase activity-associated protein Agl23 [Halorhabdus sp. CBA1104]